MAYCHIPYEKRSKLDQTAKKGYLEGYSETSKAYRIYIPSNMKIVVRRDAKFTEDRAFRKPREMLAKDQSGDVLLVKEKQGQQEGQAREHTPGSSTITSTSISSEGGNADSSQQMKRQDREEELVEPPTTSGRTSREVRQTPRDIEDFVGAPRTEKRHEPRRGIVDNQIDTKHW